MYSDWLLFNTSNHVWSLLWICSSRISLFSAAVVVNIWEVPLGNFLSHLVFLLYSSHPLSAPNSAICYTFFPPPLCSALASSHPTPTSLSVSLHLPTTQSLQCLGMELSPQEWVRTLKGEGGYSGGMFWFVCCCCFLVVSFLKKICLGLCESSTHPLEKQKPKYWFFYKKAMWGALSSKFVWWTACCSSTFLCTCYACILASHLCLEE